MNVSHKTLTYTSALFLVPAVLVAAQAAEPRSPEQGQPAAAKTQEKTPPTAGKLPGRILVDAFRMGDPASKERVAGVTGIIAIDPETEQWRLIVDKRGYGRFSPDGQTIAFLSERVGRAPGRLWTASVRDAGAARPIADLEGLPVWSRDGKQLVVSARAAGQQDFETWRLDADGANPTRLALPGSDQVYDWSAAGELLVVRRKEGKSTVRVVRQDGTEAGPLNVSGGLPRFSPTARRIVYTSRLPGGGSELTVSDVDGSNARKINLGDTVLPRACWSPDGRWLAVSLTDLQKAENGRLVLSADPLLMNCRIEIVDEEGKQRRPLALPPGYVMVFDWE